MDFSTSEITLKRVRGNNVEFSTIEITPKKYAENDAEIRRKLVVDVSWIGRGVPIGKS